MWYQQTSKPLAKVLILKPSLRKKKCKDQCSNKNKLTIKTMKTTKLKNALSKFKKSKTTRENVSIK